MSADAIISTHFAEALEGLSPAVDALLQQYRLLLYVTTSRAAYAAEGL